MPDDIQAPDPFSILAGQPIQMPNLPQSAPATPELAPQPVKGRSRLPGVAGLISNLVHPPTQTQVNPQTNLAETRPQSRLDVFENFLGNFLYSLGQGMANQGHGPGSFARGFGAAVTAPMQRDIQLQQLANQQMLQQSQARAAEAEAQQRQAQAGLMQQSTPITLPNGQQVFIPSSQAGQALGNVFRGTAAAQINAQSRMSVEQMKAQLMAGQVSKILPVQDDSGKTVMRAYNKYGKVIGDIDGALPPASYLPKSSSTQEFKQLEDGSIVAIPKTTTSGPIIPRAVGAGGTPVTIGKGSSKPNGVRSVNGVITDGQGNPLQFKGGLTTTTKSMVEASPKVIDFVDRINDLIDKNRDQLGPLAGRWNEYWTGKVGTDNKAFTQIRTNVGLLQTLLMRMHVGARGGEYIMKHFQDLIDSGKQSPDNLKAALGEVKTYAEEVKNTKGIMGGAEKPQAITQPSGSKVDSLLKKHGF